MIIAKIEAMEPHGRQGRARVLVLRKPCLPQFFIRITSFSKAVSLTLSLE